MIHTHVALLAEKGRSRIKQRRLNRTMRFVTERTVLRYRVVLEQKRSPIVTMTSGADIRRDITREQVFVGRPVRRVTVRTGHFSLCNAEMTVNPCGMKDTAQVPLGRYRERCDIECRKFLPSHDRCPARTSGGYPHDRRCSSRPRHTLLVKKSCRAGSPSDYSGVLHWSHGKPYNPPRDFDGQNHRSAICGRFHKLLLLKGPAETPGPATIKSVHPAEPTLSSQSLPTTYYCYDFGKLNHDVHQM